MTVPTCVNVSRVPCSDGAGPVWLYFDAGMLVELSPVLALDMVYQLAEVCGLSVTPQADAGEVAS